MILRAAVVLALFGILACTPSIRLRPHGAPLEPRSADCSLRVYEVGELVDVDFEVLGDIYVTDSGFTIARCGKQDVRDLVRREACRRGADGIEVYRESHPDFWSTCYRIKARFLAFDEE